MSERWIDNKELDWHPAKDMVGKIVRFGNGAIGVVLAPDHHYKTYPQTRDKEPGDVRIIQFISPEGIIDFLFVEHLGFAEDYDMCYDYEIERTDPNIAGMMKLLHSQVEDGDKFKLMKELFSSMSGNPRNRNDEDMWGDFRKLFPAHKRYV